MPVVARDRRPSSGDVIGDAGASPRVEDPQLVATADRIALMVGKKTIWKANYDGGTQATLAPESERRHALGPELEIYHQGARVLALRCASVIDRDALVNDNRLFELKACESRGVRWAGDVQAVSLLRQWLATGLEAAAAGGAGSGGGGGGEMLRVRAASQVPLGLTIASANVLAAEPEGDSPSFRRYA